MHGPLENPPKIPCLWWQEGTWKPFLEGKDIKRSAYTCTMGLYVQTQSISICSHGKTMQRVWGQRQTGGFLRSFHPIRWSCDSWGLNFSEQDKLCPKVKVKQTFEKIKKSVDALPRSALQHMTLKIWSDLLTSGQFLLILSCEGTEKKSIPLLPATPLPDHWTTTESCNYKPNLLVFFCLCCFHQRCSAAGPAALPRALTHGSHLPGARESSTGCSSHPKNSHNPHCAFRMGTWKQTVLRGWFRALT